MLFSEKLEREYGQKETKRLHFLIMSLKEISSKTWLILDFMSIFHG